MCDQENTAINCTHKDRNIRFYNEYFEISKLGIRIKIDR